MLNYDTMLTRLAAADVYPYNQAHDWEVKGPTVRLRYHMNDDILCTAATVARDYDALDADGCGACGERRDCPDCDPCHEDNQT